MKRIVFCCVILFNFVYSQIESTPYDLIRPVWQLSWDSTIFNIYDTSVTTKKNMLPRNKTPEDYKPNTYIPDTLNQAFLDAINLKMSPIRVNQAGYMEKDTERQFYFVGNATDFSVVDENDKALASGVFNNSGKTMASTINIVAGTNAATNDQKRYDAKASGPSGNVMIGSLALDLPVEKRLRVKVNTGGQTYYSSTFVISDNVYGMVRDATLKFMGINRSGNSQSWFHPASHTKDGGGKIVNRGGSAVTSANIISKEGALSGGWYDCGDHLKESQTQAYAFAVLSVLATSNPNRDDDHYAYNHSEWINTDGIPDILREAKHGADFALKSYDMANGVIDDMALSVGNFGADHGWWSRPENQDYLPPTVIGRGGPHERDVRLGELGANISSQFAAGLALLSVEYAPYDPVFAQKALKVAEEMYDFAKNLSLGNPTYGNNLPFVYNTEAAGWASSAYNGNNEDYDDLGLVAISLLYATQNPIYLSDAVEDKSLAMGQTKNLIEGRTAGAFRGGWFARKEPTLLKSGKNTSWANIYTYTLYAFYKLILQTQDRANLYGISNELRLEYIEDVIYTMIANLGDRQGSGESFDLPQGSIGWKSSTIQYDALWYNMATDQTWIYNRYQSGNIFEVLAYADIAKDLTGVNLPQKGMQDWKADEMQSLGVKQMNYMLGVNPWDISFLYGVGDKNDAHPHHRAANPEGRNVASATYTYRPPVGALFGGITPGVTNDWVPSTMSWEDYHISETCIDGTVTFLGSGMLASPEIDKNRAPTLSVEIRYVGLDSAIITVKTDLRSNVILNYGTSQTILDQSTDETVPGVLHEIVIRGLKNGTSYYFTATATNVISGNSSVKYLDDEELIPYDFTTLNSMESAIIENIKECNVSADSAEIMWYTPNGSYDSKIYWDTVYTSPDKMKWNSGAGNADVSGIPTKFHYVKIGGLKEKTTYYYAVESNGEIVNVDDEGKPLTFTTPVMQYDFEVRTYQYDWQGMSAINMNIFNNEARAFDSLTVRVYMRGTEAIYKDIGIRMDICQAYDEAGFNKACSPETVNELTGLFRVTFPEKIPDTYDPNDGTWQWYFPIPLGSTVIKSSSRLRIDVMFDSRSKWAPYLDLMNSAPEKKLYCQEDRINWYSPGTYSASPTPISVNPGDWSWMPHGSEIGSIVGYDGMPCESKDAGDMDLDIAQVNHFVTVYRKDEFVWGQSPSYSEMITKRANYEMALTLEAPFDVSNGTYVEIDQASSVVYVRGTATITEGGFVTSIWANGTKVENLASAAIYNNLTGKWDLEIPVKMGIGTNKVDITVFAGPDPSCEGCEESGSCNFINRNYYIQFSKGDLTASSLTITDVATGEAVKSPAIPGSLDFSISVKDDDKIKSNVPKLSVLIINNSKEDTLMVDLKLDKSLGKYISTSPISAVSKAALSTSGSEISFFGGDTIQVIYIDPDDSEDVSKQIFYADPTSPSLSRAIALDENCDGMVDKFNLYFSQVFSAGDALEAINIFIKDPFTLEEDSLEFEINSSINGLDMISINVTEPSAALNTSGPIGNVDVYIKPANIEIIEKSTVVLIDGILPTLTGISVLENINHEAEYDTLMISFSEEVLLSDKSQWLLNIYNKDGVLLNTDNLKLVENAMTDNNGKSWMYIVSGNDNGNLIKATYTAYINDKVIVNDNTLNQLDPINGCVTSVDIIEVPKPVVITIAKMEDQDGDTYPDVLYLQFARKLREKDILDSFVVNWGSKKEIVSYLKEDWINSHDYIINSRLEYIDSVNTITIVDTLSVFNIPIGASDFNPLYATAGSINGLGEVTPRLGAVGGFYDASYPISDEISPRIAFATLKERNNMILDIEFSEAIDTIPEGLNYITKMINGDQIKLNFNSMTMIRENKWLFFLEQDKDEVETILNFRDSIRISIELPKIKDLKNNLPSVNNPWVIVDGVISSKNDLKVDVQSDVSYFQKEELDEAYPRNIEEEEIFRISVMEPNTEFETELSTGSGRTNSIVGVVSDTSEWHGIGPTFISEITIPEALGVMLGDYEWSYNITYELMIYDALGQFVTNISTSLMINDDFRKKFVSNIGKFYLRTQWLVHENGSPTSSEKRAIGSGAYIAKTNVSIKSQYILPPINGVDESGNTIIQEYELGDRKKSSHEEIVKFGFVR